MDFFVFRARAHIEDSLEDHICRHSPNLIPDEVRQLAWRHESISPAVPFAPPSALSLSFETKTTSDVVPSSNLMRACSSAPLPTR